MYCCLDYDGGAALIEFLFHVVQLFLIKIIYLGCIICSLKKERKIELYTFSLKNL